MTAGRQATDEELLLAVGAVQHETNRAFATMVELIAEIESRGLADARGFRNTADLLQSTQNVAPAMARARVRAATAVVESRTLLGGYGRAELPVVAAALREAAISAEHVGVIQNVLASVPLHLEEHRPALEAELVEFARAFDPEAVRKLGKRALALLDPDGPCPRNAAPVRTRLSLRPRGAGFEARGWFDQESAAVLRSALSPLTRPAKRSCDCGRCGPGNEVPGCEVPGRDERSVAERMGDGLVELARRAMTAGALGVEGGVRPTVTVTVPLQVLQSGAGSAFVGFGAGTLAGIVSAEDARRYACDSVVVPVVICDATAEPLALGREQRLASRAQRRALAQRDGGCAFPGCEVPPQWCDAHHLRHWVDGGATDLDNLALLCGRHHRMLHEQEWTITMSGGFPVFHPPRWVPGGPRRNMIHRPDLVETAVRSRERPAPVLVDLCPQPMSETTGR
ncbi:MAG: HNH endonuclease [Pseudonocardia sp.]|nr:HNH endonuclease [Pseudonocardia sp.]